MRQIGVSMNIKKAKEEIKNTIAAYLKKDEYGNYQIPVTNQRPILLIGPPGIGKTAVMEQIASECNIALAAYTITHHTRQSAIGLPFITTRNYGGVEYSVTEYTMSEIVASVYRTIEETGLTEGILFIDEINCVSETLAAPMLQFLKEKAFGNHKIPQGFIIVAAGNPPEYNKSARDFDIATLDRLRQIHVKENYSVWKEYAYKQNIHDAIITYLDIKKDNFYHIETKVDGTEFVTARGWEDLSKILHIYEELSLLVEGDLIYQYVQNRQISKDFHNYYDFYQKYKKEYSMDAILEGVLEEEKYSAAAMAPFDERLTIIGLLLSKLYGYFRKLYEKDLYVNELYDSLKAVKERLMEAEENKAVDGKEWIEERLNHIDETAALISGLKIDGILDEETERKNNRIKREQLSSHLDKARENSLKKVIQTLYSYKSKIKDEKVREDDAAFQIIKQEFEKEIQVRKEWIEKTTDVLRNGFLFMEQAFGESQEMVIFITELTMNYYSSKFIGEYGSKEYDRYQKDLMFHERHEQLSNEIDEMLREL